jgi:tetratricopeptide (TPR) repeat protein
LDTEGNASPAILIDNATAANRAVNIPEFLNIPAGGLIKIDVPAAESYRLLDHASELAAQGKLDLAIAEWRNVLEIDPRNAAALNSLGAALMVEGNTAEARKHLQQAHEIDPLVPSPEDMEITFELQSYDRQQFTAALASSNCKEIVAYGQKLLASSPDKDVDDAIKACAPARTQP